MTNGNNKERRKTTTNRTAGVLNNRINTLASFPKNKEMALAYKITVGSICDPVEDGRLVQL